MKLASILALCLLAFSLQTLAQTKTIKIDGSSTVYPITEAVAEEFQTEKKSTIKVTVGVSGTGGGFKKFCRGETDVQGASRPISKTEMEDCKKTGVKFFELPVAYDATVVAVHPSNTWLTSITVEELKKIWEPSAQGKISKWKQINPAWPDTEIKLYGAGSDSGTFDYFTEAIVGKAKSSRGDYTASEDDNVLVKGIAGDKNSLGYLPLSYYSENSSKIKAVAIVQTAGKSGVLPNIQNVENNTYVPLSRPLFIYVSEKSTARPEVKEFVEYYMKNAAQLVPTVKYVPLPEKAYTMATEHFRKGKMGTVFSSGSHVGLKIEDLLKKEASF